MGLYSNLKKFFIAKLESVSQCHIRLGLFVSKKDKSQRTYLYRSKAYGVSYLEVECQHSKVQSMASTSSRKKCFFSRPLHFAKFWFLYYCPKNQQPQFFCKSFPNSFICGNIVNIFAFLKFGDSSFKALLFCFPCPLLPYTSRPAWEFSSKEGDH